MINIDLLKPCKACGSTAKVCGLELDMDTNEETYLKEKYYCKCGYITVYREVINYV